MNKIRYMFRIIPKGIYWIIGLALYVLVGWRIFQANYDFIFNFLYKDSIIEKDKYMLFQYIVATLLATCIIAIGILILYMFYLVIIAIAQYITAAKWLYKYEQNCILENVSPNIEDMPDNIWDNIKTCNSLYNEYYRFKQEYKNI